MQSELSFSPGLFSGSIVKAQRGLALCPARVTSCGMRLDDEAVRIAIGLRLGLELCVPYQCHCGDQVDAFGRHAFVCKKGRWQINSAPCFKRAAVLAAAIRNTKEPQGLCRSDGKRPGGLTLVPWQSGRSLVLDVTVVCLLADSYVASAAREARSVAELAATGGHASDYLFQPVAVETLGPINESASDFFSLWAL